MKLTFLLSVLVLLFLAAVVAAALKRPDRLATVPTRPKALMTQREQAMYWRLREAFPSAVVLAQVAFSALVTSPLKHRNRFDRKVADFVLCDPSMRVQAVIELDDASHRGREVHDAAREALLTTAGYKVLRFSNVPDLQALQSRLQAPAASVKARAPLDADADGG